MLKGVIYMLTSAFLFAFATVLVKIVTLETDIPSIELSFIRFSFGFIAILSITLWKKKTFRPVKAKYVYLRAVFNTVAVIFFFMGVQYSNVGKANLLNMTYPIFVFLLAPFLNREKTSGRYFLYLLMTIYGIFMIVSPENSLAGFKSVNIGDLLALLSGITAGFAITSLREARKDNPSYIILLYLMGFGTILNAIIVIPFFVMPKGIYILHCLGVGFVSLLGQVFITMGYKYIDAAPGALISASRIVFAIVLGIIFFSDPFTERMLIGTMLISASLIGVAGFYTYVVKKLTPLCKSA